MPLKRSRPGRSGHFGRFNWPTALITAFAVNVSCFAVLLLHDDVPQRFRVVVRARLHFGVEADVFAQTVVVDAFVEVLPQHFLLRVELRPVVRPEAV